MDNALNSARSQFLSALYSRAADKLLEEWRNVNRTVLKGTKEMATTQNQEPTAAFTRAPVVTLNNGVKVANFCDSENIIFKDGNLLPGCDFDRVVALEPKHQMAVQAGKKGTQDLVTKYASHKGIVQEMQNLDGSSEVDIVLVTIPVMEALREWGYDIKASKARTKVFDKITNTIRIDQFGSGLMKVDEPTSIDQ